MSEEAQALKFNRYLDMLLDGRDVVCEPGSDEYQPELKIAAELLHIAPRHDSEIKSALRRRLLEKIKASPTMEQKDELSEDELDIISAAGDPDHDGDIWKIK